VAAGVMKFSSFVEMASPYHIGTIAPSSFPGKLKRVAKSVRCKRHDNFEPGIRKTSTYYISTSLQGVLLLVTWEVQWVCFKTRYNREDLSRFFSVALAAHMACS